MGLDIWFNKVKHTEIGYFRKVNFLVKFFEDRGFEREKSTCYVSEDDARDLLDCCNRVLEDHSLAEELLPTTEGFFFGDTEYDEYYFDDVKDVKEFCENTLIPKFMALDDGEEIQFNIWY
jgi:hypothetical protein